MKIPKQFNPLWRCECFGAAIFFQPHVVEGGLNLFEGMCFGFQIANEFFAFVREAAVKQFEEIGEFVVVERAGFSFDG